MGGRWQPMSWRDRTVPAWLPDPLSNRRFEFSDSTVRAAERATAALARADAARPRDWEPLARLLLRAEGIASSSIEGITAPALEIAAAEFAATSGDAGWIVDNLNAYEAAVSDASTLSVAKLHRWHDMLMGHSALDAEMIGAFRAAPSWIGGTSPHDAAFVPPPPEAVAGLVDELVEFANEDHFDPVTQAALVHAQFETIHPYGDGNGRLGRVLIGWLLCRRRAVAKLPPPISVLIARDAGGYISGLHLFREGPVDRWVRWFADITGSAAERSAALVGDVGTLVGDWEARVSDLRADAAARRLVPMLPQMPVLTTAAAAELVDGSERAARAALDLLLDRAILVDVTDQIAPQRVARGRPATHYAAIALLDAIS